MSGSAGGAPTAATMRRSSTDESTYHRSPSLDSKDFSFPQGGGAFRRYSSMYGATGSSFFGFHTNPGPKATKAKYTSPKGNKYVVFYLDLSFIFLLELKRCSMARNCLQCIKYLMFTFNLLFWVSTRHFPALFSLVLLSRLFCWSHRALLSIYQTSSAPRARIINNMNAGFEVPECNGENRVSGAAHVPSAACVGE
ncbi:hypothetical protein NDU88_003908 [Pleurodeles waltl]|uniref:Uncharacterized protein n=1 Tax=Pleurodeles waltl TaxID=8319 RepID=A0AAV7TQB5_PLEWA|nr:hypothetical protein NDU88_003908 [Pleurodeles waltl]